MVNHFNEFKKYAFRLEVLQSYSLEEEKDPFEKFLKEEKVTKEDNEDWLEFIQKAKSRGAIVQRVRVVSFPLSDYMRFQMENFRLYMAEGEEIYTIAYRKFLKNKPKIKKDFWLFDDKAVLVMNYDKKGRFLGFNEWRGDISEYIKLKDLLLANAKKFT
ncbi:MAG: hypothetical protein Q7S27_03035 [Nanoarchaeota archaeon]|nr:hypothetical protein [Nanoarchaeota archaeon]